MGQLNRALAAVLIVMVQAGCATQDDTAASAQDEFFDRLSGYCGQAFGGEIIANLPPVTDDPFANKALVMHVRDCESDVLRFPFHVGDDHSRTWVISRTATGMRLKHDHRHEDGSSDAVTWYGGDTASAGSVDRQEFPVDEESRANFRANELTASLNNVWAIELTPDQRMIYELRRPTGRLFQVAFDLTRPVAIPPPAWGHE